jgi:hypothetical protein
MAKRGRRANATGRNDTEQYFPLSYAMARSPAWRSLSGPATKIFCELRCRYSGANNGDLSLSLDEATRLLGIGKATAARAFGELVGKGFIVLTHRGRWIGRKAATYRVTDRSYQGHPPTRDWHHWQGSARALRGPPQNHERLVAVSTRTTGQLCGPPQNPSGAENARQWSAIEPPISTMGRGNDDR